MRALGSEGSAPYEIAKHPLTERGVIARERYSIWLKTPGYRHWVPARGRTALRLDSEVWGPIADTDDCRPFTPVVLVDGEPVAAGFGVAEIDLDPGRHFVQVQAGASGAYRTIEARTGRLVRLTSAVRQSLDHRPGDPESLLRQFVLVPSRVIPPRLGRRFTPVVVGLGAVAGAVSAALIPESLVPTNNFLIVLTLTMLLVVGGLLVYWPARLIQAGVAKLAELRLSWRLPAGRHPEKPVPGGTWRPVDPRDGSPPTARRSEAILWLAVAYAQAPNPPADRTEWRVHDDQGLEAAAERRRRFGEEYPPDMRPWVDPPLVVLDGEEVQAIWGINEYRLKPGRHRITVSVPPPPDVLTGKTAVDLGPESTAEFDIELTEGRSDQIEATAEIEMVPGHEGWELERYSGVLQTQPMKSR